MQNQLIDSAWPVACSWHVFPATFQLVVGHPRGCSYQPNLSDMKQWCRWSPGPAWSQMSSAWPGNCWCPLQGVHSSTAVHRTRTPKTRPPPLAELSSRNTFLPISSSQPFIIPHPAGLHSSPSHPSQSHLPGLNSPNPLSVSS